MKINGTENPISPSQHVWLAAARSGNWGVARRQQTHNSLAPVRSNHRLCARGFRFAALSDKSPVRSGDVVLIGETTGSRRDGKWAKRCRVAAAKPTWIRLSPLPAGSLEITSNGKKSFLTAARRQGGQKHAKSITGVCPEFSSPAIEMHHRNLTWTSLLRSPILMRSKNHWSTFALRPGD
jgi:hypothetical protein